MASEWIVDTRPDRCGDPVAIRVRPVELQEQGHFNFTIIYRSLAGAPEEIRTPDPQIRSLMLVYSDPEIPRAIVPFSGLAEKVARPRD
jgi:hypothetical protein